MKITKLLIMAIILFSVNKVQAQNTASQISDEQAHEIVLHGTPAEVQRLVNNGYDINRTYHCNTLLNIYRFMLFLIFLYYCQKSHTLLKINRVL